MKPKILSYLLIFCIAIISCGGNDAENPDPNPNPNPNPGPGNGNGNGNGNGGDDDTFVKYYVAVNGSDSNEGTISSPFATVNHAIGKTNPGDTVYVRGGTYTQRITVSRSGTEKNRIVIMAYPGETPVLDGSGMTAAGMDALIRVGGVHNVTVHGFEAFGMTTTVGGIEPNGVVVDAGSTNITVSGCHIYGIHHLAPLSEWPGAHAIHVIGNTDSPLKNILIEGNIIHDCKTGYAENLTINGYVDGFTIKGNTLYNCENIGIDAAGGYMANSNPSYNYARNGVISDNIVYNVENERGRLGGYGAVAIYADGSRHITIERNRVFTCDRGIGIVSETDDFPTSGCIVRNNLVYDCWRVGIYTGGYLNYTGGGTSECYIVNNTLVGNNRIVGYFDEIEGEIRLTEHSRNNYFYNNLICSAYSNDLFVHKYTDTGYNNYFDNNLYCGPGGWMWETINTGMITDFGAWKNACGGDNSSIRLTQRFFGDVTLDESALFTISSGSEAKNTGKFVSSYIHGNTDFAGNPRSENGQISIGAYQ